MISSLPRPRVTLSALVALLMSVTGTAQAQVLHFDDVTTNAAGFNTLAFTNYNGYTLENFGVLTSASAFGTGNNEASPSKFAYGQAFGSSFLYRTDIGFNFASAYLSFRQLDLDASPATITVRGYRAGDINATFTKDVLLTNSAQLFNFDFLNVEELEFETDPLQFGGRSAVLAVDNVDVAVVPEPASIALFASGLLAIVVVGRKRIRRGA